MKYYYTAVLTPQDDGSVFASVPDLDGCVTSGKDLNDALDMITDAASVWLVSNEDHNLPVVKPSVQSDLPCSEDSYFSIIRVDTIQYRADTDNHSVRKNVSLPAWMAHMADKRGINCSKVLQDGLMQQFS